jgi:hypothetical protein
MSMKIRLLRFRTLFILAAGTNRSEAGAFCGQYIYG